MLSDNGPHPIIDPMPRLQTLAAAKVNLTLRVLARRADNNHDLTSLVAFAAIGDRLELDPGSGLELSVHGPTAAVFQKYQAFIGGRRDAPYAVSDIPKRRKALVEFIGREGNDLARAARSVAPVIAAAEESLDENRAELVRMSGSGSGVFGIFEDKDEAKDAALTIRKERPGWWAVATTLR